MISNKPGEQSGIGNTASAITPYINDQMADIIFLQSFERAPEKSF